MVKNVKKKILITALTTTMTLSLVTTSSSASIFGYFENEKLELKSSFKGLPLTISTYDNDGQKIDQIKTKSARIHTDEEMSKTDSNGNEKSSVIDIDYGNHRITHVGSTLIAYEGLKNYSDAYAKKYKVENNDSSIPVLNQMYQNFKNNWNSQSKLVAIRSQTGKPIAVFTGNNVSIHQAEMKNTTKFVIDGHRLIVYRADYTVYPMSALK